MPEQLQLPSSAATFIPATWAFTAPAGTTTPTHNTTDASAGQRSALERRARLTAKLAKLAATGQLPPLARQIAGLGGCAHPIRLTGHRTHLDSATGEVLDHFDSSRLPAGELLVRCGNRRATRCPACSTVYRYDTYQLIAAGLRGGKTVPTSVAAHPRVFATLTAPGFGPVHNQPDTGRCHCGHTHPDDDPLLGTPLDPEQYDYAGAVLWNAHAPALWARFTTHLRREIAKAAGLTQRVLSHHATLSYAKVAEYQKRGQVHFHAAIRLDGPTGPTSTPPAWATTQLLDDAVRAAAQRTRVHHEGQPPKQPQPPGDIPASPPQDSDRARRLVFRFGRQIDVRAIRSTDFTGGGPVTDRHVAGYIAKYATKGAETTTGTLDRRLRFLAELATHDITDHARRMIHTAWNLATNRQHSHLRLRQWAHMLGFRGHFATRTRHYSTTLTHLRAERTAWRLNRPDTQTPAPASAETQAGQTGGRPVGDHAEHSTHLAAGHRLGHGNIAGQRVDSDTTLVISHWQYAGTGLLPELEHLGDLLTATRQTRPEQPTRTRHSERPSDLAGHPVGHSIHRLTGAVRAGAVA
ncbi:replication initiator [Streptomyces chromofuscus]|uniref:Replication initiation protein n=1 Tax=Streptomyces chromofuscus TaxID=42881 RepID=A0A7M2T848_STRCW|nr:replication initiator [Streptomyces chromofuscus]QOV43878.1 Replication initiation protein [Streptomyces chromofuscus]GGT21130.1 replication initiation protein [Streptomyces chromofuscus]